MLTTLCYIKKDNQYLMLCRSKKENDLNAGKWIGVGGKFEKFESPDECLLREVEEETSLKLIKYELRGIITFINNEYSEHMFLYTADEYEGLINYECKEGQLKWVDQSEITKLNLWEGDRYFIDKLINDDPFFTMKLSYHENELVGVSCNNARIR